MARRVLLVTLFLVLSGCSSRQQGLFDFLEIRDFDEHRVEMEHPGGPIAEPQIPPELAREAAESAEGQAVALSKVSYRVITDFGGSGLEKGLQKDMSKAFMKASLAEKLRKTVPTDLAGLDQRMRSDLDVAIEVLHAYGFYTGEASGSLNPVPSDDPDAPPSRYEVIISFSPGQRYHLGANSIGVTGEAADDAEEEAAGRRWRLLPKTLADIGLAEGAPVLADEVLEAVSGVRHSFRTRGYPFAELKSARYFLNHEKRLLEVEIQVESGEKVKMGDLELRGLSTVVPGYFDALVNWRPGRLWNQDIVDTYRENLRQTGLFASVETYPSETLNERGERNVVVEVVGALERTVGGALRYDSDLGFGVLGYWENRNLTGRGDRLRFELPIWQEKQEFATLYRQPFFLRPDQDLIINGGVLHEDNDSYKLFTANGAIGLERRFGRSWSGTARVRGEGGQIEEVDKKEQEYYMFGLPLSLTYNNTRRPLDATKGLRATLSVAPYGGYYEDYFQAVRTRLDANVYLPLVGRNTLVLALRGVYGSLFMADAEEVPPTIRFYSGGGGSVRGYDYRSVGPRNADNDPLGGTSLVECSMELRWRFANDLGLVLFTDGGMVYTDTAPSGEDLLWGAGLGLRYYTVLGPVRFDVAFPVNKRSDDSSVQLYISIGQSF